MKTTTSRFSTERVYGYVTFILVGKEFELPVYQSKDLIITEEYADYLFFPFTDQTNGKQTYAGGRYIDLRIPKEGDNLIVDFGYEALVKFLSKNMAYPKAAVKQKIEGVVYVQFIIQPDGSISGVRTLRGFSTECDMEAERVVSLMPKWKPGQVNGENVAVRFVLPISFKGGRDGTRTAGDEANHHEISFPWSKFGDSRDNIIVNC